MKKFYSRCLWCDHINEFEVTNEELENDYAFTCNYCDNQDELSKWLGNEVDKVYQVKIYEPITYEITAKDKETAFDIAIREYNGGNMHEDLKYEIEDITKE